MWREDLAYDRSGIERARERGRSGARGILEGRIGIDGKASCAPVRAVGVMGIAHGLDAEFHPVDQPESGKARLNIRHECVEFGGVERAPGHVDREGMGGAGEGFESGDVVSGCESKNAVSDGSLGAVTVRGDLCRCTKIEHCALFEFYKTPKQANPILFFGRLLCGRRQRLKLTRRAPLELSAERGDAVGGGLQNFDERGLAAAFDRHVPGLDDLSGPCVGDANHAAIGGSGHAVAAKMAFFDGKNVGQWFGVIHFSLNAFRFWHVLSHRCHLASVSEVDVSAVAGIFAHGGGVSECRKQDEDEEADGEDEPCQARQVEGKGQHGCDDAERGEREDHDFPRGDRRIRAFCVGLAGARGEFGRLKIFFHATIFVFFSALARTFVVTSGHTSTALSKECVLQGVFGGGGSLPLSGYVLGLWPCAHTPLPPLRHVKQRVRHVMGVGTFCPWRGLGPARKLSVTRGVYLCEFGVVVQSKFAVWSVWGGNFAKEGRRVSAKGR